MCLVCLVQAQFRRRWRNSRSVLVEWPRMIIFRRARGSGEVESGICNALMIVLGRSF